MGSGFRAGWTVLATKLHVGFAAKSLHESVGRGGSRERRTKPLMAIMKNSQSNSLSRHPVAPVQNDIAVGDGHTASGGPR